MLSNRRTPNPSPTITQARLKKAGLGVFFRARDLPALGLGFRELARMVAAKHVEKLAPGLYRLASAPVTENESIATVAAAVPNGIVCLLTALRFHEIGTQVPRHVWIALDRKARKPTRSPVQLRVVRFSGPMLRHGVETHDILGVPVRITSPARTAIDCFRYRSIVGFDVALEALRETVQTKKATIAQLDRMAELCRVRTVIAPYLTSLVR